MPRSPSLDQLLTVNATNLALVIGNGVNRYGAPAVNSWDQLLVEMARDCDLDLAAVPHGTALTEFYDVLELRSRERTSNLQARFCELMSGWRPLPHHKAIMGWAERHKVPVLTTNFDEVLSNAAKCRFLLPRNEKFTDFYPWEGRFAHQLYSSPCDGFGIWHINGMARYKRSVRLGLSHYMGSVQRARTWLHRSGDARLFHGKDRTQWAGAGTWMHLVFNKPLLIFGLALEENEVFLRWLLIERAKYFREFPARSQPAWYVYKPDPTDDRQAGKHFFLKALGIDCVEAKDFAAIYDSPAWTR
jgi:hypothetical protein